MYNYEQKGFTGICGGDDAPMMSPRISFSNDFVEAQHCLGNIIRHDKVYREGPVSSDFEFSVGGYSMMTADELFSKGRLLPLKQRRPSTSATTLRDELLLDPDHGDGSGGGLSSIKPPKGSTTRWKGLLGLRKSHIGSKKVPVERPAAAVDAKGSAFSFEGPNNARRSSQD